jgi:hypothetical protein
VGAYLNAEISDEIYMDPPPGVLAEAESGKVCRLLEGLYGLKQAGREWYNQLRRTFIDKMKFTRSATDHSVFFRHGPNSVVVAVSTDDMLVAASTITAVADFKSQLASHYELTNLGEIRWLLGFRIRRDRIARTMSINQCAYIESVADKFRLTDSKPTYTPMDPGIILSKAQCPIKPIAAPYREACGSVLWAAMITCPDMLLAVGVLSQFIVNPAEVHWNALKWVIKYLLTTKDFWLTFGGHKCTFEAYTDADWVSQPDRHLISGYALMWGEGAFGWSSKKQPIVALSTTEAEYIAATHASKEILWVRAFVAEFTPPIRAPTTLYCDNQSAIELTKDDKFHARTKHIDIRFHFVREAVENGVITPRYVPSDDNIADIFTKALPQSKFDYFVTRLRLRVA